MGQYYQWDDRSWEHIWEQLLGPLERRNCALYVWKVEVPTDPFLGRVVVELARRWRQRAVTLIVAWSLWTLFWATMTWQGIRRIPEPDLTAPVSMLVLGVAVVYGCVLARRRFRPVADRSVAPPGRQRGHSDL